MNIQFKCLFLLLCATVQHSVTVAQTPSWNQTTKWTLYNTNSTKFYKISADSLSNYPNRLLNTDSMQLFLLHVTALQSDKPPIWMGAFVTSCMVDGKLRKIDISRYGGFFFDETDRKFYEVSESVQKDWLNYLVACASALASTK